MPFLVTSADFMRVTLFLSITSQITCLQLSRKNFSSQAITLTRRTTAGLAVEVDVASVIAGCCVLESVIGLAIVDRLLGVGETDVDCLSKSLEVPEEGT